MNITVSENLKNLRKNANKTQDNLADFLAISISAVSKWERGECYPDIELLPRIAAFYDVTVDDLLGVGELRKKERIAEIHKIGSELLNSKNYKQAIKHYSNAFNEFPHDKGIILRLAMAWGLGGSYAEMQCAADYCESILREYNADSMQHTARAFSAYLNAKLGFAHDGANKDYYMNRAMEIAKYLPHSRESRHATMGSLEHEVGAENIDVFLRWIATGDR